MSTSENSTNSDGVWVWIILIFLCFNTCGTKRNIQNVKDEILSQQNQLILIESKLDSILNFFKPKPILLNIDTVRVSSTNIKS